MPKSFKNTTNAKKSERFINSAYWQWDDVAGGSGPIS